MQQQMSWNINEFAVNLSGLPLDGGGYPEDEVFTLEWDDELYTLTKGCDGSATRESVNSHSAIFTARYVQTAVANDILNGLMQTDLLLPNGGGAGMFLGKDLHGRMMVQSPGSYVMARPKMAWGKKVQVVEWKIQLPDARGTIFGGR